VNCAGDASLVGGGLAWVEDVDGWGNYLFYNSGIGGTRTLDSYGTIDLAWSPGGNEIATVDGTGSVVVLDILSGQKTRSIGSGLKDVAITQGPGTDQYSVLELRSSCRIVILGGHAGTEEAISCGAATAVQQGSADIAWSPDGRTAAVASYNATAFRLVERESATVRNVPLPDHRFAPVATAWATNGTGVFVLGLCLAACTPGELSLLIFDRESGSWKEVGQWPTDVRASFEASLEVFGAKHVAVGPVNRSVLLVPIDRPGEARVLLGPDKFRVARRPG
jgi:WD40 repeat protein